VGISSVRASILIGCLLATILTFWPAPPARAAPSNDPVDFNIPAGNLSAALDRFAEQSGLQIVYDQPVPKTAQAKALNGHLPRRAALDQLLKGSGLAWSYVNDSTVVVRANKVKASDAGKPGAASGAADAEGPVSADVSVQSQKVIQVYQAGGNVDIPRTVDDVQPYYIFDSQTIEQSGALNTEDFLKQRLTMNTQYYSQSQAYGGSSLVGNTNTINLRGLGTNETLILVDGHRMAGVQVAASGNQPDINGIPLAAIDRIEVLPSSASGIYGGGAIGGVVNIILKKNYQGGDFRYAQDNPTRGNAPIETLSGTYGFSLEGGKTNAMITGSYSDSKPLLLQDRADIAQRGLSTILQNQPAFLYSPSTPFQGATPNIALYPYPVYDNNGNLIYTNPQNSTLTLKNRGISLNSPITHLSPGAAATDDQTSALLANAGSYNTNLAAGTGPLALQSELGSNSTVKSLTGIIRRQMTSSLEAFVEVTTASNLGFSMANPYPNGGFVVPGNAPTNPFQENVMVAFPTTVSTPLYTDSINHTITTGLTANLPANWNGEMDYTWAKNNFRYYQSAFDSTALGNAFDNGTLNPFVDTIKYPLNLTPYLVPRYGDSSSTVDDVALRTSGPLLHFSWGDPILAMSLEHRKEGYPTNTEYSNYPLTPENNSAFVSFSQAQVINSIYAELQVPLVTPKNALPGLRTLELQLAERSEWYSVSAGTSSEFLGGSPLVFQGYDTADANGNPVHNTARYNSNNGTFGLKYMPVGDVAIRVSHATAFLPPTYGQFLRNPTINISGDFVSDPRNPGIGPYPVNTISGGNPAIKPEHDKNWNAGLIYEPKEDLLKDLRIDLEFYKITQIGYITALTGDEIVNDPGLASRVTRNPVTGLITQIDETLLNATNFTTDGWDLSLDYRKTTSFGIFDLHAGATLIEHEKRQFTVDAPALDFVGYPSVGGEAKTKANAALGWAYGRWTLAWITTWFDSYGALGAPGNPYGYNAISVQAQGADRIPAQAYHQVVATYNFGKESPGGMGGLLSNLSIQLGIKNIFNTSPPFDLDFYPIYYSPYGDIRLRDYWINLKKGF